MAAPPPDDEQAYLVLEARAGGMSYAAINREFGISRVAAKRIEADPETKASFAAWAKEREAMQAAELVFDTMSITEAANQLGISRVTLYTRLKSIGIPGIQEMIALERSLLEVGAMKLSASAIRAAAEQGLPAMVGHLTGDNPEWSIKAAAEIRHLAELGFRPRAAAGANVTVSTNTTVAQANVAPSSAPTADEMDPDTAAEVVRILRAGKRRQTIDVDVG